MKRFILAAIVIIGVFAAAACQKTGPAAPANSTATITPTATQSGTITLTPSITQTFTITPTNTEVTDILIEDFEDSTLSTNLIDPPNNSWLIMNDSMLGSTSTWAGQSHCTSPGYAGFGLQSMSLTGTVRAHYPTAGQYMGLLSVTTTVKTNGQGIDATKYSTIKITMFCDAVPPSGNMFYTFRLYNPSGQYVNYNPSPGGVWSTYTTSLSSFITGGAWPESAILSNLSAIEVRVQLFTTVQDAEVTFNLCLDYMQIVL